ncbi:GNAT family N-acetyltransferase [Salimicrobium jeotgali]|uniref:GNAT family N-acetyltransferase n=1 Tax=Salimicrobium jeotgali TaxID=1230341 RepID=K2FLB2_9BACI|nr:GNAT family protein [Salimicrobium jeotgali]AKG04730.1 GNAT family N-acetyltransferase [Salimicrobium jeotgali]EKE31766.1 GNAT family acetyltransferase [Salimicrobium jeotgali]MBM7696273.1 RimJ/RimL family protein N-acetyltransferase [Salimicrobium jeotgali]
MVREINLQKNDITLRSIRDEDLPLLYQLIHGEKEPLWKKYEAPFYSLEPHTLESYTNRENARKQRLSENEVDSRLVIETNGEIVGTVVYYWEEKLSYWLEVGIGIYNPAYWGKGIGTRALNMWIDYLFRAMPLVRIGIRTWSKNDRMLQLASKLGMKEEARIRKAHLYRDSYYDSVRFGVLREEWYLPEEDLHNG